MNNYKCYLIGYITKITSGYTVIMDFLARSTMDNLYYIAFGCWSVDKNRDKPLTEDEFNNQYGPKTISESISTGYERMIVGASK